MHIKNTVRQNFQTIDFLGTAINNSLKYEESCHSLSLKILISFKVPPFHFLSSGTPVSWSCSSWQLSVSRLFSHIFHLLLFLLNVQATSLTWLSGLSVEFLLLVTMILSLGLCVLWILLFLSKIILFVVDILTS